MRNLKKLAAMMLALVMTLALSVTAFAAVDDTGFSDVDGGAWYAEAVVYCHEHDLMYGITKTMFAPDSSLTRAMLVTVLYRMAGSPAVTGTDAFSDTVVGAYYSDAVLWASQQGVIGGYGNGLFGTNDPVSREQLTTILWRYAGSPAVESTANFTDRAETASYAVSAMDWASANGIVRTVSSGVFAPKVSATRAQVADALMNYSRAQQTDPIPGTEGKVLVAYFSATNTTEGVAQHIADALDASLYEITPAVPYTAADLDYNDSSSRSTLEMNDSSSRPEISGSVSNMEDYDIVFLGYPIWWGEAPKIVSTFLEGYDFSGKTIVPFCTSSSSSLGSSATNLHSLTDGASWLDGQRFSGGTSHATVVEWVNGLGLDVTAD